MPQYIYQRVENVRKRADEERGRADEEEAKTRCTTLAEYLLACHVHLSRPLTIQGNKSFATRGSITNPKDKPCPTLLKPSKNFTRQQQKILQRLTPNVPACARSFTCVQSVKDIGRQICNRPLASEKNLETYPRLAAENPVAETICQLQTYKKARKSFKLEMA